MGFLLLPSPHKVAQELMLYGTLNSLRPYLPVGRKQLDLRHRRSRKQPQPHKRRKPTPFLRNKSNPTPTICAEASRHRASRARVRVDVRFQDLAWIGELDVGSGQANDVGWTAGEGAAVVAVTYVAVWFREEVLLGEGYGDGAAEAGACHAFLVQFGDVVVLGVAGEWWHGGLVSEIMN